MDINTLAAWGEFLGGIAVVVSLVYLASQIRQNSRLLKNSTAATMGDADLAMGSLLAADPKLSVILAKGLEDPESLSAEDRLRFPERAHWGLLVRMTSIGGAENAA